MDELLKCPVEGCDYETESKRGLGVHKASHSSEPAKKTYTCAECGDTFEDYPSRREHQDRETFFCSKECKNVFERGDGLETTCDNCGDEIYVPPSHLDGMGGYTLDNRFCDKECESEWKTENWAGEDHPKYKGKVATVCEECGQIYEVKPSVVEITRFCSWECKQENWADGPIELICPICDTVFERQPCEVKGDTAFCSHECWKAWMSSIRRGDDNPAWKDGRAQYYGPNWEAQRRKALERDSFECQICGMGQEEHLMQYKKQLNMHHIQRFLSFDGYEAANQLNNLTTLCHGCHVMMERQNEATQRFLLRN